MPTLSPRGPCGTIPTVGAGTQRGEGHTGNSVLPPPEKRSRHAADRGDLHKPDDRPDPAISSERQYPPTPSMINRRLSPISLHLAAAALCSSEQGLGAMAGSASPPMLEIKWEPSPSIFWDGPRKPIIRDTPKQSRNSRCLCGSGRKHKRCCGQNSELSPPQKCQ